MTKYFYNNPLHAAIMAEQFGMDFQSIFYDDRGAISFEDVRFYGGSWIFKRKTPFYPRDNVYYIHPDSLHLLNPQVGDFGLDGAERPCKFTIAGRWNLCPNDSSEDGSTPVYPIMIVSRWVNGKCFPFIWPEVKAEKEKENA